MMLTLGIALCLAAALPAVAGADVQTVTFDAGPPAGPALETPVERFDEAKDILFPHGPGFRPYRTEVGGRAHSGSTVGNVGRCIDEAEESGACESFHAGTGVQLTRSAETVTVFAGRFGPVDPTAVPEGAILTAFDAHGEELGAAGPIPIDDSGFDTRLSVSNANGEIASFTIEATRLGAPGDANDAGDLGIDDLTVNFANGGPADFSVSTTNQVVRVPQGLHVDVPVQLPRLNGSNGPIRLSVSGLPSGVSATVLPENPVPGAETTATLRLSADPSAPADFIPTDATITADPQGNSAVGPGLRTTTVSVRVATNFGLSVNGLSDTNLPPEAKVPIEVPDCAPVDLPLKVSRDIAFNQNISLSLREDRPEAVGLPQGVSAEILPSAVVPPGGDLVADRTLRFRADSTAFPGGERFPAPILLEARSGALTRVLPMTMVPAKPQATIAPTTPWSESPLGHSPRLGKEGTRVQIHGTGFCPGTAVSVGHDFEMTPTTFVNDHTIEFNVPRYATTGPITINPPGSRSAYTTENSLTVDSDRNSDGFQFKNYGFGALSFGEFVRAFGADEAFIHVNPCWPLGDCTVSTGIPNQLALIEWGALNLALRDTNGHCFGMSLAIQDLVSGKESYRQFAGSGGASNPSHAYELAGPDGPSDSLGSFLDVEHAKQASDEFLSAYFDRSKSVQGQLNTIAREFSHGREPIVSMRHDGSEGHAVLAYDMTQTAEGAEIYVYDSRRQFQPEEDLSSAQHRTEIEYSVIHVDKANGIWGYKPSSEKEWTGGDYGTLWAVPQGSVPDDPSLPSLGALKVGWEYLMGGSSDGAVQTLKGSAGAEYLPILTGGPGAAGSGGTWVARSGGKPLDAAFEGVKPGHYTEAYSAPGFVASVSNVETGKGVRDTLKGAGDSLTLASGQARPLRIELAQGSSPAMTTSATLDTHTSADGSDTAGFSDGGALSYAHDGAPTTVSFTLSTVRRDGGPATFVSGPVAVGRGDRLSVKPLDRGLHHVRLAIRDAHGKTTTRLLRNRGRAHIHLKLGAPKVSGHRLSLRFKLSGLHKRAIVGAVLRLVHGGHLVAHKAVSLRIANGTRKISLRLPRAAKQGHYRLLTNVRAIAIGAPGAAAAGNVSAHRATRVQIKR